MLDEKPYRFKRTGYGFHTIEVDSFSNFFSLIGEFFSNSTDYVWRGCRNPEWHLIPTLTRALGGRDRLSHHEWDQEASYITSDHLRRFLLEIRGVYPFSADHHSLLNTLERVVAERKRSFSSVLAQVPASTLPLIFELFSTGQHYRLATPLLDWTKSPYIATYFAFEEKDDRDECGHRVVYGINRTIIEQRFPPIEAFSHNSARREGLREGLCNSVFSIRDKDFLRSSADIPSRTPIDVIAPVRSPRGTRFLKEFDSLRAWGIQSNHSNFVPQGPPYRVRYTSPK